MQRLVTHKHRERDMTTAVKTDREVAIKTLRDLAEHGLEQDIRLLAAKALLASGHSDACIRHYAASFADEPTNRLGSE